MVGIRIFLIGAIVYILPTCLLYGLRPIESGTTPLQKIEREQKSEIESDLITEKNEIMEKIAPLRQEREKNLRPFTYPAESKSDNGHIAFERKEAPYIVKNFTHKAYDIKNSSSKDPASSKNILAHVIFFCALITAFLFSYFFIKPSSRP